MQLTTIELMLIDGILLSMKAETLFSSGFQLRFGLGMPKEMV